MKRIAAAIFIFFFLSYPAHAEDSYPRLANYYLQPHIPAEDKRELAKFDLVILDIDSETIDMDLNSKLKQVNPDIVILAYIPSQSVNIGDLTDWAQFRRSTYKQVESNDWWLKDSESDYVYFSNTWPTIRFVDAGQGWGTYLSDLAAKTIKQGGEWDGVFYDMVFGNISWLNNGDIDLNNDGRPDSQESVNAYWRQAMGELLADTRDKIEPGLVVANIDIVDYYQRETNGVMMENFPAAWLGKNGWSALINKYLNELPQNNSRPQIYIINANTDNNKVMDKFRQMRYGLSSTLLGDGYYSFDEGDQNHGQVWWFDEYDVSLGQPISGAFNTGDKEAKKIELGLWRRDFTNGIVLVNSTNEDQVYISDKEEFEKINGIQDKMVNDGSRVNWVTVPAKDGIILKKINKKIIGSSFLNGSFIRVFNGSGVQSQNGFFAYQDKFSGQTKIMSADIDGQEGLEMIVSRQGKITIYKQGDEQVEFYPYGSNFRGLVSFDAADLDGDGVKEIITGAGPGGGPHVRVFSKDGRPLTGGFFAYDRNFRGGVNVATGDLDGDGVKEIITGAGPGGGSHVRVFNRDGQMKSEFMAYGSDYKSGINVMSLDINNDQLDEILVGTLDY